MLERLTGQQAGADAERIARVFEAVHRTWTGSHAMVNSLLLSLPERYLLANRPESIVQHCRAVSERRGRGVCIFRVPSRYPEAAELCIVADDRPGLLERIAAALTANRLDVVTAEAYSHLVVSRREALDLFWVRDREGGTEGVVDALPRLSSDLDDVCSGRVAPSELLRRRTDPASPWRERPSPDVATEIVFDGWDARHHTIVEVYAKDCPGLLYRLARTLHELGLSISSLKVNTEGARVADVFYVSELDGSKITPGLRHQAIRAALVRAVAE